MDALMGALVAALFAQVSDRMPWLTAIMGTRYARPGQVIAATALAIAAINAIGAISGVLIAPHMPGAASQLLLGLALLSAGGSALFAIKPPDRLSGWRTGAFLTTLLGVLIMGFGDRTQFITAAFAARSPVPWLAAIGATIGSLMVNVPAILAGEPARRRLPVVPVRLAAGALFLIVGAIVALSALGLI